MCTQTFLMPAFTHYFVGAIGDFFVVHAPGMAGEILVGVVADGVALDGVGLEGHGAVEIVEPAGRAGREDCVGEHAAGAGGLVHFLAGRGHHFVGEEPVAGDLRGRAGDQGDLGVAIEEDFLVVVVVLQVLDGLLAAFHLGIPAGVADRLAHFDEGIEARIVAQEMGVAVEDELILERVGALLGEFGSGGFGVGDIEDAAVDLVHGQIGGGHSGGGAEEGAAADALLAGQFAAHVFQARLDLALLLVLPRGKIFIARDDLRGDRRGEGQSFGGL